VKEHSICGGVFDVPKKKEKIQDLDVIMQSPIFWDDPANAQKFIQESNELKSWVEPLEDLLKRVEDVKSLAPDALSDESFMKELENEVDSIEKKLEDLEARRMLSHEMDKSSCFLSVNAGAGGTEACDWAEMLLRMYQRWASKKGWKVEVVDILEGEVAGVRNATIRIEGPYAYGYAKAEKGVHRLVRISPFDSNARRHTSFAAVDVVPEVADDVKIEIRQEDLRVDTFRASGAGGQHVNRTDSAVRITHLPTGLVVSSQSQRSQIQNKESCMKMLRSKLYDKEMEERKKKLDELGGEKKEIGWGSQIRSYVFQPYTLVKDTRTKYEIGNVQAVMDGEIDPFIHAYLKEFGG
jgi:peptide chain release factor 2